MKLPAVYDYMKEKDILVSLYRDIKKKAAENMMITSTKFLSPEEKSTLLSSDREYISDISVFFYGGYDEAERTAAVFVPVLFGVNNIEDYFKENPEDIPFCVLRIAKDKFSLLGHRDYLGSLMGLGIKRELIGDIRITDEYCFVFVIRSIAPYICENLSKVGRGSVKCEICDVTAVKFDEEKTEIVFSSVSSLRLDCIVAAAFNLSRGVASEAIKNGFVFVDSVQTFKTDINVKERSKIVLRGKGKVVLEEVIGESKKGRIHINLKKYK